MLLLVRSSTFLDKKKTCFNRICYQKLLCSSIRYVSSLLYCVVLTVITFDLKNVKISCLHHLFYCKRTLTNNCNVKHWNTKVAEILHHCSNLHIVFLGIFKVLLR